MFEVHHADPRLGKYKRTVSDLCSTDCSYVDALDTCSSNHSELSAYIIHEIKWFFIPKIFSRQLIQMITPHDYTSETHLKGAP